MNLSTTLSLYAGGVGSGRHKAKYVYKEQTEEEFRKEIVEEATKVYNKWRAKGGGSSGSKPKADQSGKMPKKVEWAVGVLSKYGVKASNAGLEREGIPEETGRGLEKKIKKVGTQFCITSDGVDKNFGCWPDKKKAEAVKSGQSFISPDIDAGGPGSGRHKEGDRVRAKTWLPGTPNSFRQTGTVTKAFVKGNPKMGKLSTRQTVHVKLDKYPAEWSGSGGPGKSIGPGENWEKLEDVKAGGPGSGRNKVSEVLEQKGWQRTKDLGDAALYRHPDNRHDKIAVDDRYETWSHGSHVGSGGKDLAQHLGSLAAVSYGKYGVKPTVTSPYKTSTPSGVKPISMGPTKLKLGPSAGHTVRNPGTSLTAGGPGSGRKKQSKSKAKDIRELTPEERQKYRSDPRQKSLYGPGHTKELIKHYTKTDINADQGEPLAGMYQHANFDTNLWFHPPSLKKPTKVPVDNPDNKDNRFLDVTKRNSKDTQEQRMKLLKRQSPGPNVPVRTTLISPNLNSYMPMNASAVNPRFKVRPRADLNNAVMRRAYGSAKI